MQGEPYSYKKLRARPNRCTCPGQRGYKGAMGIPGVKNPLQSGGTELLSPIPSGSAAFARFSQPREEFAIGKRGKRRKNAQSKRYYFKK
jgi:hypothetical protein